MPRQNGVNIRRLVKTIKDSTDKDKAIDVAKQTLKLYLDRQSRLPTTVTCFYCCQRYSCRHTFAYFSIKIIYLINTISQFFLLNAFLSFHFTSYGIETFRKTLNGEDWFESPRFPRITMCDFMVRRLGSNQHWYSVQCNLPYNMYNEKIFLGIWFWLIILSLFNLLSIISWIISLIPARRLASIRRYLEIVQVRSTEAEQLLSSNQSAENRNKTSEEFLKYLRLNGYLFFRLIARNTDEIVAGKLIRFLYENYE